MSDVMSRGKLDRSLTKLIEESEAEDDATIMDEAGAKANKSDAETSHITFDNLNLQPKDYEEYKLTDYQIIRSLGLEGKEYLLEYIKQERDNIAKVFLHNAVNK